MIKNAVEVLLREKGVRLKAYGEGKEVEQGVRIACIPLECERTIEKEFSSTCLEKVVIRISIQ